MKRILILFLFVLVLSGCVREITEKRIPEENVLVLVKGFWRPQFNDDMDKDSLKTAVNRSMEYLKRLPTESQFRYGPHKYTAGYLVESMETFLDILMSSSSPKDLNKRIRKQFHIYRSIGSNGKGSVIFTGYYEPILKGSLTRSDIYKYPIYMKPSDLMVIPLEKFHPRFKDEKIVARYDGNTIAPYYDREEIDVEKILEGKGLELLWISDNVELFFMQIQGSGVVKLEDNTIQRVHYAASNGKPYRSIGRKFIDEKIIPREDVSFQALKAYLQDHPEERDRILNYNESYVFFEKVEIGPLGNIEVVLTPGRSIATDYRLFPKGGLSFIVTQKPEIDQSNTVTGWREFSRFVVNQDTGGAIRGAGRVDLFWGTGYQAEITAGALYKKGELYFLVKKPLE
ncbi:MAG: MltA domain-containing protein [Thermodesulfobacteriota bacterium]|nr:MltA domain-containing protein [Thermodesulfobacteriota bacterium]